MRKLLIACLCVAVLGNWPGLVAADDISPVVGIYKGILPAATCCGQDLTLYANVDGGAVLVTDFMNGEPPISETGTWVIDTEGHVNVTLGEITHSFGYQEDTLTSLASPDAPDALVWTLVNVQALALNRATLPYDRDMADRHLRENGFGGMYKGMLPAATCCGYDQTLYLNSDGGVRLEANYLNGKPPVVEVGAWQPSGEIGIVLTITGGESQNYESPNVMTLELVDGVLTTVKKDDADEALPWMLRSVEVAIMGMLSEM